MRNRAEDMFEALRYYISRDHKTRFRNNMICVSVATGFYLLLREQAYPEPFAVKTSVGILFIAFTASLILYMFRHRCDESMSEKLEQVPPEPRWGQEAEVVLYLDRNKKEIALRAERRRKAVAIGVWGLALVLVGVAVPVLQGAILDRRLQRVLQGEPTQQKLEEAAKIVAVTTEQNVRSKLAVEAATKFATYRSSLQGLPLTVAQLTPLTATPTDPKGPPIKVGVGCARPQVGAESRSGAIFGFAGFTVSNCADLVIWPMNAESLRLDNLDSKNVTFVNTTLTYDGGKLKLENVRFINCRFQVPDASARNRNVLQFLNAALTGQPINVELPATSSARL